MKEHVGMQCPNCLDIIFSEYTHDFKECKCGDCFVDGGYDYCRVGFKEIVPKPVKRHTDGTLEVIND